MDDNLDSRPPLNMVDAPMTDLLKVFSAMGEEDGIIVVKDESGNIKLTDNNKNSEYLIQTNGTGNNEMPMSTETNEGVLYELSYEVDEEDDDDEKDFEDDKDGETEEGVVYELEIEEAFKPKGNVGKMKFKYPSKLKRGVTETEDLEEESEWKEMDEKGEMETTESARTMGKGRSHGRKGLDKPRTYASHVKLESVNQEMNLLREKNEEYKKALDFFRNKLNEVAVFNSNLAYSTRLFTEHTTTKQEKINILRRFDSVESLKESKSLYKTIKSELDSESSNKGVFTESIERKVTKTPQNGSATNLIESKTYENPQFMRMKDLMTKIK
jgi:hypothetical protein